MAEYEPAKIEKKWQKEWEKQGLYKAEDFSKKPKFYCLDMFPYPSSAGLHVGHPKGYTATDIISRYKRMKGFNVLHPMGWDAFGLPAENYAIKTKIHPDKSTHQNIENFRGQIKSLGLSYDWQREIDTSSPDYYKWTQWFFLFLYKNSWAYRKKAPVNWCQNCQTVLANEQSVGGRCERCDGAVIKKELEQWFFKITGFADELIEGLRKLDWPESTKAMQEHWIGKSQGLEEEWQVKDMGLKLKTFTTWPHTSWGSTFMVIAPEHPIINKLVKGTKYEKGAKEFAKKAIEEKIKDPLNVEKEKKGFFLGKYVINHLNGREMPLYIANFAVYQYGTGIVKCTPTHDQRDFEFAKKYNLDLVPVIYPEGGEPLDPKQMTEAYTGEGLMMNAGKFNDMPTEKARKAIGEYTVKNGNGRWAINYKLRDWLISRQRYWGCPIPIIYCKKCGLVPVPEKDLPVLLPTDVDFMPQGKSPLERSKEFHKVKCPKCSQKARRESDTMDTFVCSSWYFLRYLDPANSQEFAQRKLIDYWLPVDLYIGGAEHTVLHLLYVRFFTKALFKRGLLGFSEPFLKLRHQGLILAEGGAKMSKSKGNVVNPDDVVKEYGADTLRVYEMFMGPFEQAIAWDTQGIKGAKRFLEKAYKLSEKRKAPQSSPASSGTLRGRQSEKLQPEYKSLEKLIHRTIKKVSEDIEKMKFNTAVSALMVLVNEMEQVEEIPSSLYSKFLIILSPFAPHLAEELWHKLGYKKSIFQEKWPDYDPALVEEERINLIIQKNGKVRDKIEVRAGISQEETQERALQSEKIKKWLKGKKVKKFIFVEKKLINIVV